MAENVPGMAVDPATAVALTSTFRGGGGSTTGSVSKKDWSGEPSPRGAERAAWAEEGGGGGGGGGRFPANSGLKVGRW